jgi:hypothetical protein
MPRRISDEAFIDAIGEFVATVTRDLRAEIGALRTRLAELEARPSIKDCGVWKEGEYRAGDGVTWDGSFWIAQRNTTTKPNRPDSDWRLAVKRGRDGRPR